MVAVAQQLIDQLGHPWDGTTLVSGGAAWSDHVAVALFLRQALHTGCALELHLPAAWAGQRFEDSGAKDWRANPGHLANMLHLQFKTQTGLSSLQELQAAKSLGAVFRVHKGFHQRNTAVAARCDVLIAFTATPGPPQAGGTADTWNKFAKQNRRRFHVSLVDWAVSAF